MHAPASGTVDLHGGQPPPFLAFISCKLGHADHAVIGIVAFQGRPHSGTASRALATRSPAHTRQPQTQRIRVLTGGALIAVAAVIIAVRSSKSASRSAGSADRTAEAAAASAAASEGTLKAAEEQLALARDEHAQIEADRARQPVIEAIVASQIASRPGELAPERTVRIGLTNSGARALEDGLLTIMLDPGSDPELTDRWVTRVGDAPDDETIERWPGVEGAPRAFDYFARQVRVPARVSTLQYVRVGRRGRFSMRVKLFSAELAGNGPWVDAVIEVDEAGVARIDDLQAVQGPFAGRCADFEAEVTMD
jgi:hypothetical protein